MKKLILLTLLIMTSSGKAKTNHTTKILFTVQEDKKEKKHYHGFETIETNTEKNHVTKQTAYYSYRSDRRTNLQDLVQKIKYIYELNSFKPIDYHFVNYQTQEEVKVRIEDGYFNIQTRFDFAKKFDSYKKIKFEKGIIIGKSLHQYISSRWNLLKEKSYFKVDVLIPSKHRVITFVVERLEQKNKKTHIRLKLNNFFFRIFAGDLNLYFEEQNNNYFVSEYIGRTPIPLDGSKNKKAHFYFTYVQEKKIQGKTE